MKNRIGVIDDLMLFEEDGNFYNDQFSGKAQMVFTRG